MKRAQLLAFAAISLITASAGAFDSDRRYAAQGAVRCAVFLSAENRDSNGMPGSYSRGWVEGYIGAFNWLVPETFQILGDRDISAALRWLDDYCRANPQRDTADGIQALMDELYPKRQRRSPGRKP